MEASLDPLARFHRTLVEEIMRTRPLYLSEPFTVSEIYQNLVPYRTHRDRIGVQMNGDYEDVLLRLLAGEGDYLVIESDHARREIQEELKSPSPNTGLYREYAAVDVRLNPLRMLHDLPDPEAGGARGTASAGSGSQPAAGPIIPQAPEAAAPRAATRPAAPAPPSTAAPAENVGGELPLLRMEPAPDGPEPHEPAAPGPTHCLWCRESLPRRDTLNYCPFCGAYLHKAPCPNCGEELEMGWRFCAACGSAVGDRG